jgi:hypothetical protein
LAGIDRPLAKSAARWSEQLDDSSSADFGPDEFALASLEWNRITTGFASSFISTLTSVLVLLQ